MRRDSWKAPKIVFYGGGKSSEPLEVACMIITWKVGLMVFVSNELQLYKTL